MSYPDIQSAALSVIMAVDHLSTADNVAEQATAQGATIWSETLDQLYQEWDKALENDTGTSTEDQQEYNTDNTEYQNATTVYNSIVSSMNDNITSLSDAQSQLVTFAQAVMGVLTYTASLLASPLS
ncbi:MAG: hypothetical protein AB7N99_08750 [Simkaniaceae bacterium]